MEYPSGLNNPDIRTSPIWVSDIGFAGMPLDMGLFTLPRVPHGYCESLLFDLPENIGKKIGSNHRHLRVKTLIFGWAIRWESNNPFAAPIEMVA